jgi:outer membrane protein OmpA-like peptidoglycan-associated protein
LVKDLEASEYFAKKGLDIMSGKTFIAEDPIVWEADRSMIEELILMQKKLEILLNNQNLIYQMPIQMAHLSYLYDCWSSKESKEIFMADELSHCRVSFGKLIDEIEIYLEENTKNKNPDVKIIEPEFSRFEIIFDAENYLLNDKANKAMIEVVDYLNNFRGKFKILITANPDNAIKALYNQALVKNRVEIVKNYLIKNGIDENSIEERIENEDFPDIIANDDIKNQINRSVGIYVLRGDSDFKPYPLPLLQNLLYKSQVEKARKERGLGN